MFQLEFFALAGGGYAGSAHAFDNGINGTGFLAGGCLYDQVGKADGGIGGNATAAVT